MPSVSLFGYEPCSTASSLSPDELVAEFVAPYAKSSNRRHGIAARHLLCWLSVHRIALTEIDEQVLQRFSKHRCICPGYQATPAYDRSYMPAVRMFVHLLAERGAIPSRQHQGIAPLLASYGAALRSQGYVGKVVAGMTFNARHFAYWIVCNADWGRLDLSIIERFARHDCSCPRAMRGDRGDSGIVRRRRHAERFLRYLVDQGAVVLPPDEPDLDERLTAYRHWLVTVRALSPLGIKAMLREVMRWYGRICINGSVCSTEALRSLLLDPDLGRSHASVDRRISTLRSFVRFLIARGECPPDRIAALSFAPRRVGAQVPRYIDRAAIEQIITASDTSTRTGLRNHAILLLLARLGLRAGDVVAMQLEDIDWQQGTIRVSGKSARMTRLPLPQEAGDAILAYIEHARPTVANRHLFLCLTAPYRPFAGPSIICWIVRKAVERAGLTNIPPGSHVFRHSLATSMLREGSTLEAIGTVLRHSKPDTTAIYAKVDFTMLGEVAQPWIGSASC